MIPVAAPEPMHGSNDLKSSYALTRASLKRSRELSTSLEQVYLLEISSSVIRNYANNPNQLLKILTECQTEAVKILQASLKMDVTFQSHPITQSTSAQDKPSVKICFAPSRMMNQIMATTSFALQREYVSLLGITDQIWRHGSFKPSVTWCKFQHTLQREGVVNNVNGKGAKRVYAVHPLYMKDDEIRSGLRIPTVKHPDDNTVFVESAQSLELALQNCEFNSTLVIDGHWLHGEASTQGVWDAARANSMAKNIIDMINLHPGKIGHVLLLGCQAGRLPDSLDPLLDDAQLFFKSLFRPEVNLREMAEFRNRAIYISQDGEMPFAPDSLAGQLFSHLRDKGIAVTASHSNTYPYPTEPKQARLNITSDAPTWGDSHFWRKEMLDSDLAGMRPRSELFAQLRHMKNITVIPKSTAATSPKQLWSNKPS